MSTLPLAIGLLFLPAEPGVDFMNQAKKADIRRCPLVLALPIFPGRLQPSIVGRSELNFRVRDGNGWTPRPNKHQLYCSCFRSNNHYIHFSALCQEKNGDPYRIRTDVNGARGRCLNHLTNGPCLASWGPHWMVLPSSGMVHLQGLEPWTP